MSPIRPAWRVILLWMIMTQYLCVSKWQIVISPSALTVSRQIRCLCRPCGCQPLSPCCPALSSESGSVCCAPRRWQLVNTVKINLVYVVYRLPPWHTAGCSTSYCHHRPIFHGCPRPLSRVQAFLCLNVRIDLSLSGIGLILIYYTTTTIV